MSSFTPIKLLAQAWQEAIKIHVSKLVGRMNPYDLCSPGTKAMEDHASWDGYVLSRTTGTLNLVTL